MNKDEFLALVKERAIIKDKRGYTSEATRQRQVHSIDMAVFVDTMEAIWAKDDTSEPSPSN